jgi:glycosyltransferase involved in cell wall biosynthesis
VRAVESIANQSLRPVEVILVNDASGDETSSILKSLKIEYGNWIKIVELSKNVGAASARNAGWNAATQPYIAFLDSDDVWHTKKIEIQYQYMIENPQIALSGHSFCELTENFIGDLNWPVTLKSIKKITWWRLLLKNQFITPSAMLKKDISNRFDDDKRYMEDHLLWLEVVGAGHLAVKLNSNLAAIYKPMYGASGLSSNMWKMEKSELHNYWILLKAKRIGLIFFMLIIFYSLAKYLRRLLIIGVRRVFY